MGEVPYNAGIRNQLFTALQSLTARYQDAWWLKCALGLLCLAVLTIPHRGYEPHYDGGVYIMCLQDAVLAPFQVWNFHCVHHWSYAYFLLIGVTQYLDFGNITLIHLCNIALLIVSMWAMSKLLPRLGIQNRLEQMLLLAIYAVAPLVSVSLFHFNLDFPLMCLTPLLLLSIFNTHWWLSAFWGFCMIFTKETGLLIYGSAIGLYALGQIWRIQKTQATYAELKTLYPLLLPLGAALLAFVALRMFDPTRDITWVSVYETDSPVRFLLQFDLRQAALRDYLFNMFALNWTWLLSLPMAIGICLLPWNYCRSKQTPYTWFLIALLIAMVYWLTRHLLWNNARYIITLWPIVFLCWAAIFRTLIPQKWLRLGYISVTLLILMVANFRTFDPVSLGYYGSVSFGSHRLLNMVAHYDTQPRDQFAYNQEYLRLSSLLSQAFQAIQPNRSTKIFFSPAGNWYFPLFIDGKSFAITSRRTNAFTPQINDYFGDDMMHSITTLLTPNERLYYVSFPQMSDQNALQQLRRYLVEDPVMIFAEDGYELHVYPFHNHLKAS